MASVKRHKTDYKGVFYIEGKDPSTDVPKKFFYIRYYKNGKPVEEKAGQQHKDRMSPPKANRLRVLRLTGKADSNNEKRAKRRVDRNRWRRCLLGNSGQKLPEEIVTTDIDKLRARLKDKGLAPATVKQGLVLLKRILNFGMKRGLCPPVDLSKLHFEMPKLTNMGIE
ncbi:MAG: hypothetical protein ACERJ1_17650 [Halodesulfovibrio sp.]|uniref:hypothetical protein n=1 Tax=Halodesulfovibrio sp. TaxID=1912772 RepID=UPI00359EC49A